MSAPIEAARDLQSFLDRRRWRFCIIGGIALLRWGEPRFTRDVEVTLLCPFGSEDEVTAPLLAGDYTARIADAREFARRNRVLLLQAANGVPIDIALAALPFEEGVIDRSSTPRGDPVVRPSPARSARPPAPVRINPRGRSSDG